MKTLLNVGGKDRHIALPDIYAPFRKLVLDIDPAGSPDILCDARNLNMLEPAQFDGIYCSHTLEHFYPHHVSKVLGGFLHVLKPNGFAHIRVPDLGSVMRAVTANELDIEDVLYQSSGGPISARDVIYGMAREIERTEMFAHKTGFTEKSLASALHAAGFQSVFHWIWGEGFEAVAIAFKGVPDDESRALFGIAPDRK